MSASLEARVRVLEDKEEIRRLMMDYGVHLDARDFKAYSLLFAENGTWEGGLGKATGPANIEKLVGDAIGKQTMMSRPNFHLMSSPEVDVDGDKARAWSRWTFVAEDAEGKTGIVYGGTYIDTFVREKGAWKFQHRIASSPPRRS